MEINFSTDADGFLSQECPSCYQQFKIIFGEGSDDPISFCPYCGYNGQQCWWTSEQATYIESVAVNELLGSGSSLSQPSATLIETDDSYDILRFSCCNETIKAAKYQKLFCVICGKEIDMQINSSNKVFLSHKGVDKKKVIDFKETLKLLGYDPWIDDDAMPAGTTLERALLQGMQDSCGVVFFITPDFKDEGFLETEVNYAIQEKRKKKEKFAIIALLFQDKEGKKGEIPELLKSYVWKKPKSSLEAFREIIRALPIKPKHIDWRDEIPGVVTTPLAKSNKTELSDEAKIILKEAAKGNTDIFYLKDLNHISLSTNGKEFFTDQDNRTRALWEGGLEDLKRRRLIIEKPNTNGQYLTLTREGFKAADELAKDNV